MKIKKTIMILCLLFFLTGCTAEYNINIEDDNFIENVSIYTSEQNIEEQEIINSYANNKIAAFYDGDKEYYYNSNKIENGFNLKFNYGNLDAYAVSSFFRGCYEKSSISSDEEKIYIKAVGFLCQSYDYVSAENIIINVTTNHEVVTHNADKVENGIYTWYPLNQSEDVNLVLKKKSEVIDKQEIIEEENTINNEEPVQEKESSIGLVILILLAFISAISLLVILKLKKSQRG